MCSSRLRTSCRGSESLWSAPSSSPTGRFSPSKTRLPISRPGQPGTGIQNREEPMIKAVTNGRTELSTFRVPQEREKPLRALRV